MNTKYKALFRCWRYFGVTLFVLLLNACSSVPQRTNESTAKAPSPDIEPTTQQSTTPNSNSPINPRQAKRGGYYLDDGPEDNPPANLDGVPDADPKQEPLHRFANKPYVVFGKEYVPDTSSDAYKRRGLASWYGKRFHGLKTSSGEIYDMYKMTAAHPTLPIPSYVRVTNVKNNKSVIVRINDRGPFHPDRIIDLSYTAAHKLGFLAKGSTMVEIERLIPQEKEIKTTVAVTTPTIIKKENEATGAVAGELRSKTYTAEESDPAMSVEKKRDLFYLQVGAFAARDNAENLLSRIKANLEQFAENVNILRKGGLFRIHLGPYTTQAQARDVAKKLKETFDISSIVALGENY